MTAVRNLARVRSGEDDITIEALYQREAPALLHYFRRNTGNCHTAPDLVQDTFVRLARSGRLAGLSNPAAYLQRIARNLLTDHARGRAHRETLYVPLAEESAQSPPTQEEAIIARQTLALYEQAIAELPERTRMIFLLQRAENLTYREIAKQLGVTLWTVEHHMKRAIAALDRRFGEP